MPVVCSDIIGSLRRTLLDPTPGKQWNDVAFLKMIAQAERGICNLKPEAYVTRADVPLVPGVKQVAPTGSTGMIDVHANVGGEARPVVQVSRALLDAARRFSTPPAAVTIVKEYTIDPRDPRRFDVWPPNDGNGELDSTYGLTPPDFSAVGDALHLADIYEGAIKDHVLMQAYGENTQRQDIVKSSAHEKRWKDAVQGRAVAQVSVTPNHAKPGGS